MAMILSMSEDMVSEDERKRQEQLLMQQARDKMLKQFQDLDAEKLKEQEKLKQVQLENERLRREKEELEKQNQKPS